MITTTIKRDVDVKGVDVKCEIEVICWERHCGIFVQLDYVEGEILPGDEITQDDVTDAVQAIIVAGELDGECQAYIDENRIEIEADYYAEAKGF